METRNFEEHEERARIKVNVQRPVQHVHRSEIPMRHDVRTQRTRKNRLPGGILVFFGVAIIVGGAFFLVKYANWKGFNEKAKEGSFGGAIVAIFSTKEAYEPASDAVIEKKPAKTEVERTEYVLAFEEIKKILDGQSGSGSNV